MKYEGPVSGYEDSIYASKFVRLQNDIYVTEPGDRGTAHIDLAEQHDIRDEVFRLKFAKSPEVDGGTFVVNTGSAPPKISVLLDSASLGLPVKEVAETARGRTVEAFRSLSPLYKVDGSL